MKEYGLEEAAKRVVEGVMPGEEWEAEVEGRVEEGVVEKWWEGVERSRKLRRYAAGVKGQRWGMEEWMRGKWSKEKKLKFRWRSGSCGLMEDMGRRSGYSKGCGCVVRKKRPWSM